MTWQKRSPHMFELCSHAVGDLVGIRTNGVCVLLIVVGGAGADEKGGID